MITKRKILVADDDRITREIIGSIVTRAGHDVVFAEDGKSAVETDALMACIEKHLPGTNNCGQDPAIGMAWVEIFPSDEAIAQAPKGSELLIKHQPARQ